MIRVFLLSRAAFPASSRISAYNNILITIRSYTEVLEDGGEVDGGSGSNSGGEFTGLHVSGYSSDGELESSSLGSADGTSGTSLSFPFSFALLLLLALTFTLSKGCNEPTSFPG